jgi:hypothetical protein
MRPAYPYIISLCIGATACSGSTNQTTEVVVNETTTSAASLTSSTESSTTNAPASSTDAPLAPSTSISAAAAFAGAVTFAWPRDCSVPVREEVAKNGVDAETHWTLTLTGEGQNLVIQLDDFVVDTVNGDEVPADQLEQVSAAFQIPPFVIGPDGQVLETREMDEFVRTVAPLLGLQDESMYPFVTSALELSIRSQTWAPWAGAWASLGDIEAGAVEYESTQDTASGPLVTPFTVESLDDAQPGQAHLRMTETVEGEAFRQLLGTTMQQLGGKEVPEASDLEGKRIVVIDAMVDPASLRPFVTSYEQNTTVTQGGKKQSKSEYRLTTFDWAASTCDLG